MRRHCLIGRAAHFALLTRCVRKRHQVHARDGFQHICRDGQSSVRGHSHPPSLLEIACRFPNSILPDAQEGTVPHRDRPPRFPWSV
eukprot:536221-Prymnesium_polylepis.2